MMRFQDWIVLCCGGYPVHVRMFSSIPGLYLLDHVGAHKTYVFNKLIRQLIFPIGTSDILLSWELRVLKIPELF